MSEQKYVWSENDNRLCSIYYQLGFPIERAQSLLHHIPVNSVKMKYGNCKYLETNVLGLSGITKMHKKVWCETRVCNRHCKAIEKPISAFLSLNEKKLCLSCNVCRVIERAASIKSRNNKKVRQE